MAQLMPTATRGWIVTGAALSINLILGALYAWGVIGKALVVQWQWTKTQAALPFTISTVSFALMMIFAGRWQDKIGPRVVATFGGVMFGLGLFASAYATTPFLMMMTFGVVGGIGLGLCYSATTPPPSSGFRRRGRGSSRGSWSAASAWPPFMSRR
jgi:OFA family oxalate/formate antiporter-like MFS transporter